jgi:hypothetical protein
MMGTMEDFVIRVTAYHGDPKILAGIPTRSGVSQNTPVPLDNIINDIDNDVVLDLNNQSRESDYTLDALIEDFQDEYGCKVNYENGGTEKDGTRTYEFDVFEPSWPEKAEAEDVLEDLRVRLVDWIQGYPTGH